jgi:hypothetical protein
VSGPAGDFIRTNPDGTSANNLDDLSQVLPEFLGDHPDDFDADWTDELQGVTHSDDHWFFTQNKRLLKFHVSTDLESDASAAVQTVGIPASLEGIGCDHFGDPDYLVVDGVGYIFVPVEGTDECGDNPQLAVFRDGESITFVGATSFVSQTTEARIGRAAWCAFSPVDGLLYSSHKQISEATPVFRYEVDLAALAQGRVSLAEADDFVLRDLDGQPVEIPEFIQGGCFSPAGFLFIVNGKSGLGETNRDGGIRVFDQRGVLWHKSTVAGGVFRYEYHPELEISQEPEGICYWDVDRLPNGLSAPHISGQLHALLLDNDLTTNDEIFLKHYRVRE